MKYIFFAFEGNSFPIAQRLIEEGQEVLVGQVINFQKTLTRIEKKANLSESKEEKMLRLKRYNHLLPKISADKLLTQIKKVKNPQDYFIFFESNNLFYYAHQLQDLGFQGNFPTEEDRLFEIDRNKAKNFVKKHYPKIRVADVHSFKKISAAKKFITLTHDVWVLKSQTDNIATFVPETDTISLAKNQIIERLFTYQKEYEESGFILEKKIRNIIEITPEKFYYNGTPLCTTMYLENKFLGSGNIGFQVGCAGDISFPIDEKSKIHDICFPPIIDKLAKQHKGFFIWDASILIDSNTHEMYFGEFCPNRPGYNTIFTEIAQAKSVHKFFEDIVSKKNPLPLGTVGASLMAFNLTRTSDDQLLYDVSIEITEKTKSSTWPYDIYKKRPNSAIYTVGYDIHLSPITGSGKTIAQAVDSLYGNVAGFLFGGVYYRPKFDFLSEDYPSSIMNRLKYCLDKKLFSLGS